MEWKKKKLKRNSSGAENFGISAQDIKARKKLSILSLS
jgi:hypothetical protein